MIFCAWFTWFNWRIFWVSYTANFLWIFCKLILLETVELILSRYFADEERDSCDPRAYCPPKCECTGTVVRCNNQALTEVPRDIPLDTTELWVHAYFCVVFSLYVLYDIYQRRFWSKPWRHYEYRSTMTSSAFTPTYKHCCVFKVPHIICDAAFTIYTHHLLLKRNVSFI